jgi:hypothetical protein
MPKAVQKKKNAPEERVLEKDETEKRLESLLFGDGDGFQNALKTGQDTNPLALTTVSDESADEAEEGLRDEDLDEMDDADVCIGVPTKWKTTRADDVEAFLPRFWRWSGIYGARVPSYTR